VSSIAVIGGGFRGIATAWLLRRAGHAVVLVEAAAAIGGLMRSTAWNGYWLDPGCHVFDNSDDDETSAMLDLLGPAYHPIEVRYASWIGARASEDSGVARLDDLGDDVWRRIVEQCRAAAGRPAEPARDLAQLFLARYGACAAEHLAGAARKAYGCAASELSPLVADLGPFGRVGIAPDALALELKRDPRLDAIVAARAGADRLRFYRASAGRREFRNYYPTGAGIGEFATRAHARLVELGVDVRTGCELAALALDERGARVEILERASGRRSCARFDRVHWALPPELLARSVAGAPALESHVRGVPLLLFYFAIPAAAAGRYSYVNDYRPGTQVFRASCPGNYGSGNCPPGASYVCCEVPAQRDGELWREAEQRAGAMFAEARALGVHDAAAASATHVVRIPAALRLPTPSFEQGREELARFLAAHPSLSCAPDPAFTKARIWRSARELCALDGRTADALAA
jgi:phytoene dehydrogenase-like protein